VYALEIAFLLMRFFTLYLVSRTSFFFGLLVGPINVLDSQDSYSLVDTDLSGLLTSRDERVILAKTFIFTYNGYPTLS
jgi:hypothetical protein